MIDHTFLTYENPKGNLVLSWKPDGTFVAFKDTKAGMVPIPQEFLQRHRGTIKAIQREAARILRTGTEVEAYGRVA